MSNQHKLLPNSELHVPKDFEPAVAGQQAWKDEREQYSWETRFELPPVLGVVDNTVAPPTEVDGDIYIIDNTGASHPDWDGATANSWVRYNAADDAWNEVDEAEGMFVYDKASGDYYFFDGSAWVAFGGGVGSSTLTGLTDTPANYSGAANRFLRVNAGATATEFVAASAINISTFNNDAGFTADQTSIVGITGTKAQFDTAVTDGNILYVGDSQTLATGVSDVTATASEVNLLDLAGLTVGWVLSADSATTASWKAPAGGADTGNILDTGGLIATATRTHTINDNQKVVFNNEGTTTAVNALTMSANAANSFVGIHQDTPVHALHVGGSLTDSPKIHVEGIYTVNLAMELKSNTASGGWQQLMRMSADDYPSFQLWGSGVARGGSIAFAGNSTTVASNYTRISASDTSGGNSGSNAFLVWGDNRISVGTNAAAASTMAHIVGASGYAPLLVEINGGTQAIRVDTLAKTIFTVPTVSTGSINLPHGVAPTSPVNGDMWTTTSSVFARINGSTVDLGGGGGADGNGIYDGNGTVPTLAVATITDKLSFNGGDVEFGGLLAIGGSPISSPGFGTYPLIIKGTLANNDGVQAVIQNGSDTGAAGWYINQDNVTIGTSAAGRAGMRVGGRNTVQAQLGDRLEIFSQSLLGTSFSNYTSGDWIWWAQTVQRMQLTNNGALGINVTPSASTQLHVEGAVGYAPLRVDTSSIDNALLVNSSGHVSINQGTAAASLHVNGVNGIIPFKVDFNSTLENIMYAETGGRISLGGDSGAFDGLPATATQVTIFSANSTSLRLRHANNANINIQPTATNQESSVRFYSGTGLGTFRTGIFYNGITKAVDPNRLRVGVGAITDLTLETGNIVRLLVNSGGVDLVSGNYEHGGTKVVGTRQTGWGAPTGTATRTTFATSTVTTEQLAERLHGLIDDLTTHGMIGA